MIMKFPSTASEIEISGTMCDSNINGKDIKDQCLISRIHDTRVRTGLRRKGNESCSPYQTEEVQDDDTLVNGCVNVLATLDRRACSRLFLRDANILLDEVLLPLSFPWSHPSAPFMKVPRDLDDMPFILDMNGEDEAPKQSRKLDDSNSIRRLDSALRCHDPGLIELKTHSDVSQVRIESIRPFRQINCSEDATSVPGEGVLQVFEEVKTRKCVRDEIHSQGIKRRFVSIRLGCSSSKSCIFECMNSDRRPLLLPARYPVGALEGKRKNGFVAYDEAADLGSYNCRQNQVPPTEITKKRPRAWVGRTRLMWTEQETCVNMKQRAQYKSMLTGEKLDTRVYKRPTCVKVGIQVGGELLSSFEPVLTKFAAALAISLTSADTGCQLTYGMNIVNEALDKALCDIPEDADNSQCSLNIEKLFASVKADNQADSSIVKRSSYTVTVDDSLGTIRQFVFHPPRLDCTATEDGIVYVSCSIHGKFVWPPKSERVIMERLYPDLNLCPLFFRDLSTENPKLSRQAKLFRDIKDSDLYCSICGIDCGTLEFDEKCNSWVHSICRIWVDTSVDDDSDKDNHKSCQLCSAGSSMVVRCAAENCRVRFHPMCALIASKVAESQKQYNPNDAKEYDAFLCTQYELSSLKVSYPNSMEDHHSLFGNEAIVHVGFCGYHNSKRQADYFGLYPGGCYLNRCVRVPPRRASGKSQNRSIAHC